MSQSTPDCLHHSVVSKEGISRMETEIKSYREKFEQARNNPATAARARLYFTIAMGLDMILKAGDVGINDVELELRIKSYHRVRGQRIPTHERDAFMLEIRKISTSVAQLKCERDRQAQIKHREKTRNRS